MLFGEKKEAPVLPPDTVRRRLVFHGRVQGVGFRYRAVDSARKLGGLTGWVKNEYDGTVLMEVQGTPEKINALVKLMQYMRYIHIERVEAEAIPVQPKERTFRETY